MLKDIFKRRRSIRKYKLAAAPTKLILQAVDAARLAPSGCNAQPSSYYIVNKREINQLKEANVFIQEFVYNAPNLIICCGDPEAYEKPEAYRRQLKEGTLPDSADKHIKEIFRGRERERTVRDVSIASTYLVLRATELGLGTCYVGLFNENRLKDILKLPIGYIIPFVIAIGYSKQVPVRTSRKKLDEIIINFKGVLK